MAFNPLGVECYHRAVKQLCGIERFMWFGRNNQNPHFLFNPRFTQLELMRAEELIENWYEVQRNLPSDGSWVHHGTPHTQKLGSNPKINFVNA